jgi:hypothetical protein
MAAKSTKYGTFRDVLGETAVPGECWSSFIGRGGADTKLTDSAQRAARTRDRFTRRCSVLRWVRLGIHRGTLPNLTTGFLQNADTLLVPTKVTIPFVKPGCVTFNMTHVL